MEDLFSNGVETQEPTQDNLENQNYGVETQEPTQESYSYPNEVEDTTEQTEQQTEEAVETVDTSEESPTTTIDTTFELNIKGKVEKYDISDPEQRSKLVEFLQKGRHYEQEMERLKKEYASNMEAIERVKVAVANKYAYDLLKGNVPNKYPIEDDFIGTTDSEEGDREAYRQAVENWYRTEEIKKQWGYMFDQTSRKYEEQLEAFKNKHKEISDVDSWIKENLQPYYEAVLSFGTKPFPDDTFEMIYYWKNKSKIEQQIREDERRKIAKKVSTPKIPQAPNQIKEKEKVIKTQFDNELDEAFSF